MSCVFFFVFSLSLSSSAAERVFDNAAEYEEALTGVIDPDDEYILIEGKGEGKGEGEEDRRQSVAGGDLVPSKSPLRAAASVQAATVSSPVYPDFDLSTIDLNSIPTNIYNIIQSDNRFVLVQVWSSSYRVFVARNGYLYYRMKATCDSSGTITGSSSPYSSGTLFGFGVYKSTTTDSYWSDSCLYSAIYNFDGSLKSDWTTYSKRALASPFQKDDHLYIYTGELSNDTCDFYFIGDINAGKSSNSSFMAATFWTTQSGTTFYGVQVFNSLNRYTDSHYVKSLNSFPSFESQSSDTQKGILGKIKELPNLIADKLKSLFIPSDGFFQSYSDDLTEYFGEHFGLLYEIPGFFLGILSTLNSYNPNTDNYSISIPKIEPFYIDSGGNEQKYVLIEAQTYTFDFLQTGAFKTLYDGYRAFIWLAYILMLFYLIWHKSQKIFGGG